MYPSTSNEINSSTTDATNNVRHMTQDTAGGSSSRQRTSRSLYVSSTHSSCSPSTTKDSPEKCLSPSMAGIQELKNLYCCNIPESMMDRDLLHNHFQQFGHVIRIYLSMKRNSCTVHFDSHHAAARAKAKGAQVKDSLLTIFWSQPAKNRGKLKDSSSTCSMGTSSSDISAQLKKVSEVVNQPPHKSTNNSLMKKGIFREGHPRFKSHNMEKRVRTANILSLDRFRMGIKHHFHSRKRKSSKALDVRKEKGTKDEKNIFSYPVARRAYEISDEVKDELDIMAYNDDSMRISDSSVIPNNSLASKVPRRSSAALTMNSSDNSVTDVSSSSDLPIIKGYGSRERGEGISCPLNYSTSASASFPPKKNKKAASASHQQNALQELLQIWNTKSKQENHSPEDRFQLLDLRDKILRLKRGRQSDLSKAAVIQGTCQDMCPEKERYQRESRHQVALYEYLTDANKEVVMDHALAVKQYSRSSADQEEPLPHELRPPPILRMTMDYLLAKVMDCDDKEENLGDWYHFLWDRTRGIRKDITQQELCDMDAVSLVEQCARFHIHCSERLVAEDTSVFDNKINSENLTKCLQTLKYMYHDMSLKGIACPNEAEFRGYIILLNLNDANFLWELKELSAEIINSEPVRFAVEVSLALSMDNYVRFFKLVRYTTYLNACILLRYFYQVRSKALFSILKSHCSRSKQSVLAMCDLTRWLAFENMRDAAVFCDHYGLGVNSTNTEVILCKDSLHNPSHQLPVGRAMLLIEMKRTCSVGEVVNGAPLTSHTFENYKPHCSFNIHGFVNEKTLDALNEIVNVETLKCSQQRDAQECDVSDDVAKMNELERIRHQEQAIEEAETWKVLEEFLSDLVTGLIKDICKEEEDIFHESCLQHMVSILNEVTMEDCKNMVKNVIREERLELLLQKQQVSDVRKYFNIWRNSVRRIKLYKKCMVEFPAWISTLTLKEQIAHLEKPQVIGKTVAEFALPARAAEAVPKIPVFDIVSCGLYVNPKRPYSAERYFKMVISIPDETESPTYGQFVRTYTESAFSTTKDSYAVNPCEPLLLERKLLFTASRLAVSVRCLVGPDMIEGGIPNPDAVAGTNGLIFLICHDSVSVEHTKRRLHEVLKTKCHYGGIPVAFLITDYLDEQQVKVGLNMEPLINETGIRICEIFHRKPKCQSGFEDMFYKGIFWLAQNVVEVYLPYCTTAENVMLKYLSDALWEKFEFHENTTDEVAGMEMDLELVIHIHNRACCELLKILTEETLNKCTIGAPEFVQYVPSFKMNGCSSTRQYEIMPRYFGSPEYKDSIVKLLKSAQFKPIAKWAPKTSEELYSLIMEYCLQSSIPDEGFNEVHMLIDVCLHKLNTEDCNCNLSVTAMRSIPWIAIFKVLLKYKLRQLDFRDHLSQEEGERKIMVAVNREKISRFIENQWLYYLYIIKEKGMFYHPTEEQTAAYDVARDGKAGLCMKRKSAQDGDVKKKWPKQLVFMNAENVNTALQKLSGWLDECYSKQQELEQKLKIALLDDGNLVAPEDSVL
ncbi:uncharacterized protein LOC111870657 isoform X2 [Cryptotermes secundus]|uniref:uncharacterized protein LOC111870657 isoform X2 n=1 Tax=Cryptotermes secundus TaxID=105785 RepID=UPI001454D330|nr:uncharacterized protein LOC111870657 isoform X2 [Cryptotermes secundus]